MLRRFPALLLCSLVLMQGVAAQRSVREHLRRNVVRSDDLRGVGTRTISDGRVDPATGQMRALYRIRSHTSGSGTPEEAARAWLATESERFGWRRDGSDLGLVHLEHSRYATHLTFHQLIGGVPVFGRQIKVNLDARGRPTMVTSGFVAGLEAMDTTPRITPVEAVARATSAFVESSAPLAPPRLYVLADGPTVLAWRVPVATSAAPEVWEVFVDAGSGTILRLSTTDAHRRASGGGLAYDPDPLSSSGQPYGGSFVDANDATNAALDAQRRAVVLPDITQGTDGLYRLEGPWVRVVSDLDGVSDIPYSPPAEADPGAFTYTRSDPRFEAVMAYYHIDASQRYVQSLQVGRPIMEHQLNVNPRGLSSDDSKSYLDLNALAFGTGGIDDAEDASVIMHEYGHWLLESSAQDLRVDFEGQALHEGWSDYWAGSFLRSLADDGTTPGIDWRRLFRWDGNTASWNGRRIESTDFYPDVLNPSFTIYDVGLLWATTLHEIYSALGRTVTDRLSLASHGYLGSPVTFVDAAEALVQADRDLYGGAHAEILIDRLQARGYLDSFAFGPHISHTAPATPVDAGTDFVVTVTVEPATAPVDSVRLVLSLNDGPDRTYPLMQSGGTVWTTTVPLPDAATTLDYHFQAWDAGGRQSRTQGFTATALPAGGVTSLFANYPEPASTVTRLTYYLQQEGPVRLELFDVYGRRVRVLLDETRASGVHFLQIDASDLAAGWYVVRLEADGQTSTERMAVVH